MQGEESRWKLVKSLVVLCGMEEGEVVQTRRKTGRWQENDTDDDRNKSVTLELISVGGGPAG